MRRRWTATIFAKCSAFRSDRSGVAAVEFALLVPVLLLMTFGTIELSRALIVHKRFQRAASMVGDLVTREKQLWPETMSDTTAAATPYPAKQTLAGIMTSAQHTMAPYDANPLQIKVYQVWAGMQTPPKTKIEWSYQYNFQTGNQETTGCGQAITIDTGILGQNGRAVFVQATYTYTPLFSNLLPSLMREATWTDTMVLTPRDVPSVMYLPGLNNNSTWDTASQNPNPCQ